MLPVRYSFPVLVEVSIFMIKRITIVSVFKSYLGSVPLGGFFCNGEIGPVGGSTHLHGYTSSFGIFREKETSKAVD